MSDGERQRGLTWVGGGREKKKNEREKWKKRHIRISETDCQSTSYPNKTTYTKIIKIITINDKNAAKNSQQLPLYVLMPFRNPFQALVLSPVARCLFAVWITAYWSVCCEEWDRKTYRKIFRWTIVTASLWVAYIWQFNVIYTTLKSSVCMWERDREVVCICVRAKVYL